MTQTLAGWEETTLGEVCIVMSWSTPSTKEELYRDWDISWITPKDLSNYNGRYIAKGERNITEAWVKNSSAQILPPNTILFSSRAPIWYVAIAKKELTTNQGFKNIICDEKESHYLFFYYWLKYSSEYIERIASGSTFSEASATVMRSLPIHLPPLPEQEAIAGVLSSFDDKIELLRAENQTLEQMAQELFKERFGKWKIGDELPEGWRVGKLGEMGTIICWKTPSKNNSDFFWWNIPFIKIPDMHWNLFILKTEDSLTEEGANSQKNKYISEWTICVSCIATVGLVSLTTKSSQTNQQINSIVPKFDNYREYLYYSLVWMKNELLAIGAWWSATLNINTTTFSNISIIIPDQETLSKFDLVIKPLFNKIKQNSEQIQTLSATRDQLLPKLMSGEVRVEF